MIVLEVRGRLGNQLFRYAAARRILHDRGDNEQLLLGFHSFLGKDEKDGWRDWLEDFNVVNYKKTDEIVVPKKGNLLQYLSFYVQYFVKGVFKVMHRKIAKSNSIYKCLNRIGLLLAYKNNYIYTTPTTKSVLLDGWFENKENFDSIKDIIQKEFTPKFSPIECNKELYEVIANSNSVCISIRRGDYFSNPLTKSLHAVCQESYFQKAISLMKEKLENPTFIFFSDDINWVKENIKIEECVCYYERGVDPVWEKLRLMYSCKHFIISNSSFSWWAQYLSRNENKIVISPNRWYNDGRTSDLLDESFIKIEP